MAFHVLEIFINFVLEINTNKIFIGLIEVPSTFEKALDHINYSIQEEDFSSLGHESRIQTDPIPKGIKLDESLTEVEQNPVISLAMEHVKRDIEATCQTFRISSSKRYKMAISLNSQNLNCITAYHFER